MKLPSKRLIGRGAVAMAIGIVVYGTNDSRQTSIASRLPFEGTAMAISLGGSALPADKRFAISANFGTFRGENAMSFGAQLRLSQNVVINGGLAAGLAQGGVGGRAGVTLAW